MNVELPNSAQEMQALLDRLEMAEETLRAIRQGEVDGVVVAGPHGDQVFTRKGADHPYRVMIEEMQEGALTLGMDQTILFSNRRFAAMLKCPHEQVLGAPLVRFLAPDSYTRFTGQMVCCRDTHTARGEVELLAADGTRVPVAVSCTLLPEDETAGICVIVTDLTAQKAADAAIRELNDELEERVAARTAELEFANVALREEVLARERATERINFQAQVLERVAQAVIATDMAMNVVYWNQAAEQLYGWSSVEAIGQNAFEMLCPRISEAQGQAIIAELQQGQSWCGEYLLQDRQGRIFPVETTNSPFFDEHGILIGVIGVAQDITARKQAEDSLRASEERFRSVLDHAQDVIYRFNLQTGNFEYISPSAAKLGGYSIEEFNSLDREGIINSIHPEDISRFKTAVALSVENGNARVEYRQRHKSGEYRWLSNHMTILKDSAGNPLYRDGGIHDITERKKAEEAIQVSLREKEVLLKEIHHRVKNNMQIISSLVSLQANELADPNLRVKYNNLRDQVRAMSMVHEKLYLSESLAMVNFAEYAQSLLNYLMRAHSNAAADIRLNLDLQPVSFTVESAVPCGLILNELVTNSFKYAFRDRKYGEISVALRGDADGHVCLRVSDNGVGLPAGLDWRKSSSLGLRLVNILATQVGGELELSGEEGTSVQLTFKPESTVA